MEDNLKYDMYFLFLINTYHFVFMGFIDRQVFCMNYLKDHLELKNYMSAALVGCMLFESNLNSKFVNIKEKNGHKNTEYGTPTSPWTYGAGLIQWKFTNRKEEAIMLGLGIERDKAQSMIRNNGLESIGFESQLKMIVGEIKFGKYKDNFYISLLNSQSIYDAVALVYCRYIHGYSNETNIPNKEDIEKIDRYIYNGYQRCLYKSIQVLENYNMNK